MASLQTEANSKPNVDLELKIRFSTDRHRRENSHTRLKPNDSSTSSDSVCSDAVRPLPEEPIKTILCFLVMIFVIASNLFFTGVIHERTPTVRNESSKLQHPLRDISLEVSHLLPISEYRYTLLTISEILLVCGTAFVVFALSFHEHRSIVFRRMFFLLTLLFAVRLISMNVTMLPISSGTLFSRCDAKNATFGGVVSHFLDLVSSCGLANVKYCGNYVYSGHMVVYVFNCLIAGEYCPSWILNLPLRVIAVCGVVCVLMSEYDYTISIITAYYITTRLFWVYHTLANNASLKNVREFGVNQICKVWWYPIFQFLEGNVREVVPAMKHSWPW